MEFSVVWGVLKNPFHLGGMDIFLELPNVHVDDRLSVQVKFTSLYILFTLGQK